MYALVVRHLSRAKPVVHNLPACNTLRQCRGYAEAFAKYAAMQTKALGQDVTLWLKEGTDTFTIELIFDDQVILSIEPARINEYPLALMETTAQQWSSIPIQERA